MAVVISKNKAAAWTVKMTAKTSVLSILYYILTHFYIFFNSFLKKVEKIHKKYI